jgi:membrane-bound inhibitor of C-type lysozyme
LQDEQIDFQVQETHVKKKFSFFSSRSLLELARKRYIKFSLGFIVVSMSFATDLIIHLPDGASVSRKSVTYQCDGMGPKLGAPAGAFVVEYINAGGNSLAIVPVSGNTLIFSNVIAGSGARYLAGQYTWWESGGSGTFSSDSLAGKMESTCKPLKAK